MIYLIHMEYTTDSEKSEYKIENPKGPLAEKAVAKASLQLIASTDFKKPRLEKIQRYWKLYDGKTDKKLRQLFNVAIPVFPGMIDTLNSQYDTPIELKFKEGDASDYFKVQKINGAFQMDTMDTSQNFKWDGKLRTARQHAIMTGRAIVRYTVTSDPEYKSDFQVVNLKNFHFQPRGGQYLENHLFCGEENIEKTKDELMSGVESGIYDKKQVEELISRCSDKDYLPDRENLSLSDKLSRFKPLNLNPENNNYVGEPIYNLCEWILRMDGIRYYLLFHPWSKTWLRFEKWKDIDQSTLLPWKSYATHPDDENFLSKAFADDLFPAADAIVAMFNQELTNREKRNFGARAYDKKMFTDVRKLDEAQHRPDALVPVNMDNTTRSISEGIYEFKTAELNGTVNLIDWVTGSLGRNTGANDLAQGAVQNVDKKASVTFAEQKSVSKRIGWASQPFQEFMGDIGKAYIYGLKEHMPAKMGIRVLGENGWDWDEITRMDLNTTKDIDVLIVSTDKEMQESELKLQQRKDALIAIGNDPVLAPTVNPQWRTEEILRSIGKYDDAEIAIALDTKTYSDKKALAKASESIQLILQNNKPKLWYGANRAFIKSIIDYASDKRATLGDKFDILVEYAMQHEQIAMANVQQEAQDQAQMINKQNLSAPNPEVPTAANPGVPGGMSRAMSVGNSV